MDHCACGRAGVQPWRQRDTLVSPASFLCGLLLAALAIALVVLPGPPHGLGWGLIGLFGSAAVVGWVTSLLHGHGHPGCVLGRGLWLGIAWPGLPVRIVLALPF